MESTSASVPSFADSPPWLRCLTSRIGWRSQRHGRGARGSYVGSRRAFSAQLTRFRFPVCQVARSRGGGVSGLGLAGSSAFERGRGYSERVSQASHFQVQDEMGDPPDVVEVADLFGVMEEPVRHMRDEALWARIQFRNESIRAVCYRYVTIGLLVLAALSAVNGVALLTQASWRAVLMDYSWVFLLLFACSTAGLAAAFRLAGPERRATGEYFGRLLSSDVWRRTVAREGEHRGYRS